MSVITIIKTSIRRFFCLGYKPITKIATRFDDDVVKRYIDKGTIFGSAVSYIYMGQCDGFYQMLLEWSEAEQAYSALGYRTLSLDAFVDYGGYGRELVDLVTPRNEGEEPVFHAKFYVDNYLDKVEPVFDFDKMTKDGDVQFGTYEVPSTKHLTKE